jgi:L-ascorbate metabolism protein UlaG (beta-lactamase superfamily)
MVHIKLVGGPTAILEVGGLRLVTDPTFDSPGSYQRPNAPTLVKVAPPALSAYEAGQADAVLLSHDQHADNLDTAGRVYLATAPLTLTLNAVRSLYQSARRSLAHHPRAKPATAQLASLAA